MVLHLLPLLLGNCPSYFIPHARIGFKFLPAMYSKLPRHLPRPPWSQSVKKCGITSVVHQPKTLSHWIEVSDTNHSPSWGSNKAECIYLKKSVFGQRVGEFLKCFTGESSRWRKEQLNVSNKRAAYVRYSDHRNYGSNKD